RAGSEDPSLRPTGRGAEHLADLDAEDVDRARRAEPDHVRQAHTRPVDLAGTRTAAQVLDDLEDVGDARRPERMALGEKTPGDVHRDAAAVRRLAVVDQAAGLALAAEAEVLVVQQLRRREAVVQLDEV